MSSSMAAIRDDNLYWTEFCQRTGANPRWKVYGREYSHALDLHRIKGLTGRQLLLAVRHAVERDELNDKQTNEWKEMETLLQLEAKYA